MERTPNKSQQTKLTLEKKILLPLLPGFELATFRSLIRRSNQQAIPAPSAEILQCEAFRFLNMQGEGHKNFVHFPNPQKPVEDNKTWKAWLENLENARLPRKVTDYERKMSRSVCEDHFQSHRFEGVFWGCVASSVSFAGKTFLKRGSISPIFDTRCDDKRTGFADRRKKETTDLLSTSVKA